MPRVSIAEFSHTINQKKKKKLSRSMIKVKSLHTNHRDYYCENLQEGSWSMDVVLVDQSSQ